MIKELIQTYNNLGIELWCEDDQLHYRAPKGSMTKEIIAEIRQNKNKIMDALDRERWEKIERVSEQFNKIKQTKAVRKTLDDGTNGLYLYVEPEDKKMEVLREDTEHLRDISLASWKNEMKDMNRQLLKEWVNTAECMALEEMLRFFNKKGVFIDENTWYTQDEIELKIETADKYKKLLRKWLKILTQERMISKSESGYKLERKLDENQESNSWKKLRKIESKVNYGKEFVNYLEKSINNLGELFKGEVEPLELLFPQGQIIDTYQNTMTSKKLNRITEEVVLNVTKSHEHDEEVFKILEIGAGMGGVSDGIINRLSGDNMIYYYTDVSNFFLNKAKERYKEKDWVKYKIFDINKGYCVEDVDPVQFDVVIAGNVLHNAKSGPKAIEMIGQLLKSDGIAVILDAVREPHYLLTSIEFIDGFHDFDDVRQENNETFFEREQWLKIFEDTGAEIIAAYPDVDDDLIETGQGIFVVSFPNQKVDLSVKEVFDYLKDHFSIDELPTNVEILSMIPKHLRDEKDEIHERLDAQVQIDEGERPVTNIEGKLKNIWKKVLNRKHIGRYENFFLMGGDSLLISQVIGEMWNQIEETKDWQWGDLMKEMLATPTIVEMAEKIEHRIEDRQKDFVTFIHQNKKVNDNEATTYVLFHVGTGTLTPYLQMVKHLIDTGFKHKMIGFSCNEADTYLSIPKSELFKKLGIKYATSLLKTSDRKFKLIGRCIGGLIALEAAKELKKHGAIVEEVVLIATNIYDSHKPMEELVNQEFSSDIILEKVFGRLIGADVEKAGFLIDDNKLKEAIHKIKETNDGKFQEEKLCELDGGFSDVANTYKKLFRKTHSERLKNLLSTVSKNLYSVQEDEENMLPVIYDMFKHSLIATCYYQPTQYKGKTCVLKCQDETENFFINTFSEFCESDLAWRKYLTSDMYFSMIGGDHITCMEMPYIGKSLTKFIEV